MSQRIVLPPDEAPTSEGARLGGWWHETGDGRKLACDLCPRGCVLGPEGRGFCFVRQNQDGRMALTTYGRSTGFCIDPIEKKPLNHFYPGTSVLSFGTAGCNLGCKFCQNWSISKSRRVEIMSESAAPEDVARTALEMKCRSVAFTYNDPVVWAEYAMDTAKVCRQLGVKTVAVTAGYITPLAREPFFSLMDAANVDLKGFSEDFYWKLAGGHLAPILDNLRWIARETGVWLEITNLVIPQANDSPDEIARMCDWIVENVGPEVPLHFSAFHPDFRLVDRSATPTSTLAQAWDVARRSGLKYVYTGNVQDRRHQSTYCPGCGRVLIERNGYEIGAHELEDNGCRHCGTRIAGWFEDAPGDWGARRMPVRIAAGSRPDAPIKSEASGDRPMTSPSPAPAQPSGASPERPSLTAEQEDLVFRAAGQRVAMAVQSLPAQRLDDMLGELAGTPVVGAFVSLKRAGQLRSCCGFLGPKVPLHEALDHAAVRAAKDDPRFPPISPAELPYLSVEVWLLWNMQPVAAKGLERIKAVVIGTHGLQIARGGNRGLLLPGVAVEHGLDSEGFLRQVCLKAGLPPDAWKDDGSTLSTFEGYAIHGEMSRAIASLPEASSACGPTLADLAQLAEFCRGNLIAQAYGATPSYYLPSAYDGGVNGVVLTVRLPGRDQAADSSVLSLRPELPLQSTLLNLTKAAADSLISARVGPAAIETSACGVSVLWDPAMHGSAAEPDLAGIDPRRRAVVIAAQGRWVAVYDPSRPAKELFEDGLARLGLSEPAGGSVYSVAVMSTEPRLVASNAPPPQPKGYIRAPAVAGRFYPGRPEEIERTLDDLVPQQRDVGRWAGVLVPHAGWIYSGRLAAQALSRIDMPSRAIVVCPKHHGDGADWAVAPCGSWVIPGRQIESDLELAQLLADSVPELQLDAEAHRHEHAIEVQLAFLARLAPKTRVVGIAIHGGDFQRVSRAAERLAGVLGGLEERPLLVISSDMNHYADDDRTRQLDRMALDAIEALDPARLLETVTKNRITMCGVLPAVLVMETLRRLGSLNRCEVVGYATSAEASGDRSRVVGYAAALFA